jgi:hypothetical protein
MGVRKVVKSGSVELCRQEIEAVGWRGGPWSLNFRHFIDDSSGFMVSSARFSQPFGWRMIIFLRRDVSALTNFESMKPYEFPKCV